MEFILRLIESYDIEYFLAHSFLGLAMLFFVFGIDDLFIDILALIKRVKPKEINTKLFQKMTKISEKSIIVIVPCWQEAGIIKGMLEGNISRINYSNYRFLIGLYPNDSETCKEVIEVSKNFPDLVYPIVNHINGPTSKGQILNHVIKKSLEMEQEGIFKIDAYHMQDSEDLMHTQVLKLVNFELNDFDFIQIPVYSFPLKYRYLIAGIYIDEFSESHTKDLLVRNAMKAAVPSAGVGTCFKRNIVNYLLDKGRDIYNPNSLTEDYELGLSSYLGGFKGKFSCCFVRSSDGKKDFIATREFFPKGFIRSVRQKTRWTIGIALQGVKNIGWQGSLVNRYFLFRDRKSIWVNLTVVISYVFLLFLLFFYLLKGRWPHLQNALYSDLFRVLFIANIGLMINRIFQRFKSVSRVYGVSYVVPIVIRWPLSCLVNGFASINALYKSFISKFTKKKIAWAKTKHESPV